jgi:Carboxypeptidase regulatory-like domain
MIPAMRMQNFRWLELCAVLAGPVALGAQQTATATAPVEILVTDPSPSGAGVPHAGVRVVPSADNTNKKLETDEEGRLELKLKAGSYALFVSAQGFREASQLFELSAPGSDTTVQTVRVILQLAAGGRPLVIYPADALVLSAERYHQPVAVMPEEFHALPHITVKVHNGLSGADETYSGVLPAALLAKVNAPTGHELRGETMTCYVLATGTDGYSVVLSLAEVDPDFRAGQVIVADSRDGKLLGKSGPYELIVPDDKRPARWVHNLNSIAVQQAR